MLWFGDKTKTLNYSPKSTVLVLTVHIWFWNTACPGEWLYNHLGNLATEVTQRLSDGSNDKSNETSPSTTKTLYRVQTGAFSKRSNANTLVTKLKKSGFDAYVVESSNLYKVQVGAYSQKSNAATMVAKLKKAGYDAVIVTNTTTMKSAAEIAKEIYNGTCSDPRWSSWSTGETRKNRLKLAGYDPDLVQSEINKLF